jgi:hypothetical protein
MPAVGFAEAISMLEELGVSIPSPVVLDDNLVERLCAAASKSGADAQTVADIREGLSSRPWIDLVRGDIWWERLSAKLDPVGPEAPASRGRSRDAMYGVGAKLRRAREHLDHLDELIESYLSTNPYRFTGKEGTEGPYKWVRVYLEVRAFPADEVWGPVIGDAVHNLRSSLDHVAWRLATPEARASHPWRIEFPVVFGNPGEEEAAQRRLRPKLRLLRPDSHATIDAVQPYHTGNTHHPLWLLRALWNTDKHRVLHTAGFAFTNADVPSHPMYGYEGWTHGPIDRTRPRMTLVTHYGNSVPSLDELVAGNSSKVADVSLGDVEGAGGATPDYPFTGLPIRQVLRYLARFVAEDVVKPLRPLLDGSD